MLKTQLNESLFECQTVLQIAPITLISCSFACFILAVIKGTSKTGIIKFFLISIKFAYVSRAAKNHAQSEFRLCGRLLTAGEWFKFKVTFNH